MSCEGKVVTITGAAGGIGLVTAKRFAAEGAHVVLGDIAEDKLQAAVKEVVAIDPEARGRRVDVTDPASITAFLDGARSAFGRIDVHVNNAGVLLTAPFDALTDEQMERHVRVNLLGMMHGTRAAARIMKAQAQGGHIINVASLAGISIVPGAAAYAASKWGIRGYTLSVAAELRDTNVRVTSICPDAVETPLLDLGDSANASPLIFSSGPPMPPERVTDAILRAIRRPRLEICVPTSRGILARISSLFPNQGHALLSVFEETGRKNLAQRRGQR
jgi:3-oxoacyl-[acyl-carrier protein] reductase